MDNEDLENSFFGVLGEVLGHSHADLDTSKTLADLGADDIDTMEIYLALEQEFGIEFPPVALPPFGDVAAPEGPAMDEASTVAHCLALVKTQMAGR